MESEKIYIRYHLLKMVLISFLVMFTASIAGAKTGKGLLADVASLKLGLGGYVIGEKLNAGQKEIADKHPVQGAYEGTYKFSDNGLFVVVDKKTDRVLALYKQKKEADRDQLKAMVVELMDQFGTPTTMAHEKIVYWAFNRHGVVSDEVFEQAKKIKKPSDLDIIATVKLNSEIEITPDPKEDAESAADKKVDAVGSVYFIITSDPLVQEFMADHPQK